MNCVVLLQDSLVEADIRAMDLYVTDDQGFTLLMVAARRNCCDTLGWLVRRPGIPLDAQHQQVSIPLDAQHQQVSIPLDTPKVCH